MESLLKTLLKKLLMYVHTLLNVSMTDTVLTACSISSVLMAKFVLIYIILSSINTIMFQNIATVGRPGLSGLGKENIGL